MKDKKEGEIRFTLDFINSIDTAYFPLHNLNLRKNVRKHKRKDWIMYIRFNHEMLFVAFMLNIVKHNMSIIIIQFTKGGQINDRS